jgi:hypothetical protein
MRMPRCLRLRHARNDSGARYDVTLAAMRTLHGVEVHIRHSNVQWYLRMITATNSEMTDRTIGKRMHLTIAIPTASHWSNGADSLWSPKHHYHGGLCSIFTPLSTKNLKPSTRHHHMPKSFSISSITSYDPLQEFPQLLARSVITYSAKIGYMGPCILPRTRNHY